MMRTALMCKKYSSLTECAGYRQRMCDGCYKRDVILLQCCDVCGEALSEDNPMHEYEGQTLCGVCCHKINQRRNHNAEF